MDGWMHGWVGRHRPTYVEHALGRGVCLREQVAGLLCHEDLVGYEDHTHHSIRLAHPRTQPPALAAAAAAAADAATIIARGLVLVGPRAHGSCVAANLDTTVQCGRDIVGVALHLARQLQHLFSTTDVVLVLVDG